MKPTEWDTVAAQYSALREARRSIVFERVKNLILSGKAQRLLDYGGGDGLFAALCADLPLAEIVTYDPSPKMNALALANCQGLKHVQAVSSTSDVGNGVFDVITCHAVWMCLCSETVCVTVLREIRRLLTHDGILYASVTHPCFRTESFSGYHTDFDMHDYLKDGTQFRVTIRDGSRSVDVIDTHWSLSAMIRQLSAAGFALADIEELADLSGGSGKGSPWMILKARPS